MKFIKRIILDNFQSHKHSIIDLDERLNVIVGPSDSGKSAIIRGIKWALYNEPSGDYFIREGEKECSVTLEFNDNSILKRYRSKSKNSYMFINNNGEENIFEGFGSVIPEEIIEALGIRKIHLDTNETSAINLGEQLEGAFLLSEKTSTRASAIGRLVGVNVIDDALREVLKDNRSLNTSKKSLEEVILSIKEELTSYEYLDQLKSRLLNLMKIRDKIDDNSKKLEILKKDSHRLSNVNLQIKNTTSILQEYDIINKLQDSIYAISKNYNRYKLLYNASISLNNVKLELDKNIAIIDNLNTLENVGHLSVEIQSLNIKYNRFNLLLAKDTLRKVEKTNIDSNLEKLSKLEDVTNIVENIIKNINNYTNLNSLKIRYTSITKSVNIGEDYISKFVELHNIDSKIRNIEKNLNMLTKLSNLYKHMLTIKEDYDKENKSFSMANSSINNQLGNYQNLLKEIEVCPFCLSEINEDKIHHIITHYIGG